MVAFNPPVEVEARPQEQLDPPREGKSWERFGERLVLKIFGEHGRSRALDSGLITSSDTSETWSIERGDPASAHVRIVWNRGMEWGAGEGYVSVRTNCVSEMWGLEDSFKVRQTLSAWDGAEQVFEKVFESVIAR